MAITVKRNMWLHATSDGAPAEIKEYPIAGSMGIFMPGSPCFISSSTGRANLADTADGTGDVWHGFIVGLANPTSTWPLAAELAEDVKVRVLMIDINDYYKVYVENNASDAACAQANIGNKYGLKVYTTPAGQIGYTTMDVNNSNTVVQVYDSAGNLDEKNSQFSLTTSPGVAIVKFLAANVNTTRA